MKRQPPNNSRPGLSLPLEKIAVYNSLLQQIARLDFESIVWLVLRINLSARCQTVAKFPLTYLCCQVELPDEFPGDLRIETKHSQGLLLLRLLAKTRRGVGRRRWRWRRGRRR